MSIQLTARCLDGELSVEDVYCFAWSFRVLGFCITYYTKYITTIYSVSKNEAVLEYVRKKESRQNTLFPRIPSSSLAQPRLLIKFERQQPRIESGRPYKRHRLHRGGWLNRVIGDHFGVRIGGAALTWNAACMSPWFHLICIDVSLTEPQRVLVSYINQQRSAITSQRRPSPSHLFKRRRRDTLELERLRTKSISTRPWVLSESFSASARESA